ncbi:PfkB family carbohydrate kinase [Lysinibacillus xylanilyticus]|uniref:PfkB family carbohydrate kinase n=1 Tax=Lysinibacillus xylanilyticus TaxID=582475 RepID=A0ABT4EUU3_9BACI|nr:PfkB family carbohydrate kinase [Lysinibacillus xylanilyticus]MCY9549416.1 PfkB family carbohydrate kinase [Lysinibacillus xylanilyticus]
MSKTEENIRSACRLLLDKGVGTVVVTFGSKGSFYMNYEESGWVQALGVDTIDTTGAGDAFNGALVVGLCRGESLRSSIDFATKVAAYVVTQMGAQPLISDSILN